jgi:hypothetical protein
MIPLTRFRALLIIPFILAAFASPSVPAEKDGWIDLTNLGSWRSPDKLWILADQVEVDTDHPKQLSAKAGKTILVNGPKGRARDLLSQSVFGDVEVHVEFLIPKGSNSGVKLQGLYEIQICDSFGLKEPKGSDCGGIYPRAELKPRYHYLDKGVPPRVNACKKPGEWQTMDIVFRAPRFDADGKKTENARFVKVTFNGEVIHDNVEAATPTGHAWHKKESATGPLLLQGDHGPVAFRHIRVRPRDLSKDKGGASK